MDTLRAFKDAATPAELDLLRRELRACVADLQAEVATRTVATPSSDRRSQEEGAALKTELDQAKEALQAERAQLQSYGGEEGAKLREELEQVKEALQAERSRRESAESNAATTKEMLQNASSRIKVIIAQKQTIARELEAQQLRTPQVLTDAAEAKSNAQEAIDARLVALQAQLTHAECEHHAQRQSLQGRCAAQGEQLQQLTDQLNSKASEEVSWKQSTDRLQASLAAAEHGHGVALAELRKQKEDKEQAATVCVEAITVDGRSEAHIALELRQQLAEESRMETDYAGRAEAIEIELERLRTEAHTARAALASAELQAEQQTKLAGCTEMQLTEARATMHDEALEAERLRQVATDAAAIDLEEALDSRRAAEARAMAAEERMAGQLTSEAAALASATEDAHRYKAR